MCAHMLGLVSVSVCSLKWSHAVDLNKAGASSNFCLSLAWGRMMHCICSYIAFYYFNAILYYLYINANNMNEANENNFVELSSS